MKNNYKAVFLFLFLFSSLSCKKDPAVTTNGKQLKVSVFVKNLQNPWGMAFLPNGDFLFCERNGNLNLLKKGVNSHRLLLFRNVLVSEGGLLGLAIDPDFNNNYFVYIYETVASGNQVVRLKYKNEQLLQDQIIISGIPKANNHDGGALRFGPDGYLFLGTGDATIPNLAQDTSSLAGKILRIDRNGNPASGNPFNNRIWTYGHRNVQGFDWNKQGHMFATEHGPSGDLGWYAHDEINLIEPGKNYGWPLVICGTGTSTLTAPVSCSGTDTWAPSGCAFIKGKEWEEWENNLIVGALRGERLIRFTTSYKGDAITGIFDLYKGEFKRLRNVIQAPDGALLFSSSNVGPPGKPLTEDDKIYRMVFE